MEAGGQASTLVTWNPITWLVGRNVADLLGSDFALIAAALAGLALTSLAILRDLDPVRAIEIPAAIVRAEGYTP